jgi:hypothetical protein
MPSGMEIIVLVKAERERRRDSRHRCLGVSQDPKHQSRCGVMPLYNL